MNKRLIQLAMNSGLLNHIDGETPDYYFIRGSASDYEVNEFAKQIILECIIICENGTATQMTSAGAAEKIKEHFGLYDV
jgi:hypothetical protein